MTLPKSLTLFHLPGGISYYPSSGCVNILGTHAPILLRASNLFLQYLIIFCLVSQICPVAEPVWVGRVGKWSKHSRRKLFSVSPPPLSKSLNLFCVSFFGAPILIRPNSLACDIGLAVLFNVLLWCFYHSSLAQLLGLIADICLPDH